MRFGVFVLYKTLQEADVADEAVVVHRKRREYLPKHFLISVHFIFSDIVRCPSGLVGGAPHREGCVADEFRPLVKLIWPCCNGPKRDPYVIAGGTEGAEGFG